MKIKPVVSLRQLWNLAQTDKKYRKLLLIGASDLGIDPTTAPRAYQELLDIAMETSEEAVVEEINSCRNLIK